MKKREKNKTKFFAVGILVLLMIGSIAFLVGNVKKQEEKESNSEKQESKNTQYLYHMQYFDKNKDLYAIYITKDWKVKYIKIEKADEKTETLNDLLNNTKYKQGIELEEKEREMIKNHLEAIDYTLPIHTKTTIKENNYKIINYEKNKGTTSEELNSEITFIIQTLAYQDKKYLELLFVEETLNNLKENQKNNQIELSLIKVNDLYKKTRIRKEITGVPDYYKQEKFTNDSIITLILENGVRNTETKVYDNALKKDIIVLEYDYQDFIRKAKEIWGPNISYFPEKYNPIGHCEYYAYNKEKQTFESYEGTGCGAQDEIISELEFAYETETTLVIIEKTLLVSYGESSKEAGIYNNVKDNILLYPFSNEHEKNNVEEKKGDYLKKYSALATYYSYTFNKSEDGSYTLASIERVKND